MSTQASAKRPSSSARRRARARSPADSCCAAASSSVSSVSVPGVTSRTTSRRTTLLSPRFFASAGSSSCSQTATRWPSAISRCRYSSARSIGTPHIGMSRAQMLAALGQHDAERAARDLGVLEEQLVEVAHPVEQQAVRIGGLDLDVLLHHRRDAAVSSAAGHDRARRRAGGSESQRAEVTRDIHGGATLAEAARRFMARDGGKTQKPTVGPSFRGAAQRRIPNPAQKLDTGVTSAATAGGLGRMPTPYLPRFLK